MDFRVNTCMRKFWYLLLALLFTLGSHGNSEEIRLRNVSLNPDPYTEIKRDYSTLSGEKQQGGTFVASKMHGKWSLELILGLNSKEPLEIADAKICGENGLLRNCLKQFSDDVPDAEVEALTIELRINHQVWKAFKAHMSVLFGQMEGSIINSPQNDGKVRDSYREFLKTSPEVKEIRHNVEKWEGKRIEFVTPSTEILYSKEFAYRNWNELANAPGLGFAKTPSLTFTFAVQPTIKGKEIKK